MTRGRIGAYLLRFQLRDLLVYRVTLPVMMAAFVAWMIVATDARRMDWASPQGSRMALDIVRVVGHVMFINVAVFLGIARLVSDDRSNGYYRFLFSKPVSLERFYAQQWLAQGASLVIITGLLGLWLQANTTAIPIRETMLVMALAWILIGGVGFALTAATNYDSLLLLLVWLISKVAHTIKDAPDSPMWPWLQEVTRFMLPTHKLEYVASELIGGNPLPVAHAAHVLAYGAVGFIVAVVLLRRTSFAR
jgi:hypothetical protein